MAEGPKNGKKVLLESLVYVSKLLSAAVIVVLIVIGALLLYFVVSTKVLKNNTNPLLSLYTIVSGSMEPNIKVYDVIIDVRINNPAKITKGDIITFISTSSISVDKIVTHRVVEVRQVNGKYEFVTKGDNNPIADTDTVKEDYLIGKTIMKIPQLGRLQFFLASKTGWIAAILIPALGVIIYDIIKLFKVLGVKDVSKQVEDSSFKEVNKLEEEKIINETFEKIKKDNLISLDEHTFEYTPGANELNNEDYSLTEDETNDATSTDSFPEEDER